MHLTPKEIDKLMLLSLGMVAERRMKKGLKLNYPEAVAYITSTALEGAREGKTVEEVMNCLLYTSPSPRDGLLSRMPSSA